MAKPVVFSGINEEVLQRAAGILDSVGWISVVRQAGGYHLAVKVRSEVEEDIRWMEGHFGGYYGEQEKEGKKVYWLNLHARRCEKFLREVRPYLGKRGEQADLLFELRGLIGKRGKRVSPENRAERERIVEAIRRINRDGFLISEGSLQR